MGKQFPILMWLLITMTWCCPCGLVQGYIGVNWGRRTSHRLIPSVVVDLLLQNDIRHVKIFSPSDNVMRAFTGGEIALTVGMPNENLQDVRNISSATYWLQNKIVGYLKEKINIKTIHVGSEPFSIAHNGTHDNALEVLELVLKALTPNRCGNITVTTPHYTDVLKPGIRRPSEATFRNDVKDKMVRFAHILNRTGAPFAFSMFPIDYMNDYDWDPEFCFVDNHSNFSITDVNGLTYRNVFEFVYDSFVTALEKAGVPDLKVMVAQMGWPTDAYPGANVRNAERFFRGFLPYIRSNNGTPLRPGTSIDVHIHSLADENLNKVSSARGSYPRHCGVYRLSGEPKYKIDFTGRGRDIYPATAKGVTDVPKRWCVFKGDTRNRTKVKEQFEKACRVSDCSALAPGASCGDLDFARNVSYAFNRYFQALAQSNIKNACGFEGLGKVVLEDPSAGRCVFPIEILDAESADGRINAHSFVVPIGASLALILFLGILGFKFLEARMIQYVTGNLSFCSQ